MDKQRGGVVSNREAGKAKWPMGEENGQDTCLINRDEEAFGRREWRRIKRVKNREREEDGIDLSGRKEEGKDRVINAGRSFRRASLEVVRLL